MTIIRPPHLGQDQRSLGPMVETSGSVCGAEPSCWKQSGKLVGTFVVGEEAEVPDAHETFGEQMQQEVNC